MDNKSRIIPSIGYQEAKEAIKWLCDAFNFHEDVVHETENGKVAHAQLTYQGNMIMIGSSDSGSEFSQLTRHPRELGGFVTQSPYIIIDEDKIDAHYERAKNHGAEILLALKSEDYGGKNYTCKDPEGHIWNFGSYNPWSTNVEKDTTETGKVLELLKESLWKQFGASIDMLQQAIALGPESLFLDDRRFFYTCYHSLIFLDYYLTLPPKDFTPSLPFTIREPQDIPAEALDDVIPDKFYSRDEMLDYLQSIREKCHRVINGLTEEKVAERWVEEGTGGMNYSFLEILLYNMRHVQHHTGQLNLMLRKATQETADWIQRAQL